jgi:uncharacterized phage protein (TIGR01671 family)
MREIKFRMWSYEEKMVYRNLTDRNWYFTEKNDEFGCHTAYLAMPEDRTNHIMQYTEVNDKNDIKIYESDILKIDEEKIGQVCFLDGSYYIDYINDEYNENQELSRLDSCDIEVIGNIHENLNLMEENKHD